MLYKKNYTIKDFRNAVFLGNTIFVNNALVKPDFKIDRKFNFSEKKQRKLRKKYNPEIHFSNNYNLDLNGATALHAAVIGGHIDILRTLLENGADINAQTDSGDTALHIAAIIGLKDIIKELLSNENINVDVENNSGKTAFFVAEKSGSPLKAKNTRNILGLFEQYYEKEYLKENVVKKVSFEEKSSYSLLKSLLAIKEGEEELSLDGVDSFHQADDKKNRDDKGKEKEVAKDEPLDDEVKDLHYFAENGLDSQLVGILNNGAWAKIDAQNEKGDTALHLAVSRGHTNVAAILLKNGASPEIRNKEGYTAENLANVNENAEEILDLFEKSIADRGDFISFDSKDDLHSFEKPKAEEYLKEKSSYGYHPDIPGAVFNLAVLKQSEFKRELIEIQTEENSHNLAKLNEKKAIKEYLEEENGKDGKGKGKESSEDAQKTGEELISTNFVFNGVKKKDKQQSFDFSEEQESSKQASPGSGSSSSSSKLPERSDFMASRIERFEPKKKRDVGSSSSGGPSTKVDQASAEPARKRVGKLKPEQRNPFLR